MMPSRLSWVELPFPGRLTVIPRPHPDTFDWLRAQGVDLVVSLLGEHEAQSLGLNAEAELCRAAAMDFRWLPVTDHGVPSSFEAVKLLAAEIGACLRQDQAIAIHCYAGLGRSPLLAGCVLVHEGLATQDAFDRISAARGYVVPEMEEQFEWVATFEQRLGAERGATGG